MSKQENSGLQENGSAIFALRYALTSLRHESVRNAGIALVLAIGISFPCTVIIWTSTGARIALHDYLSTRSYQYAVQPRPNEFRDEVVIDSSQRYLLNNPLIDVVHKPLTTIGLLNGEDIPDWNWYGPYMTDFWGRAVYSLGMKDTEVFFVNNNMLNLWEGEFSYEGKFSLSEGEILVSENFTVYAQEVHGIEIELGTEIDIDLVFTYPLGNLFVNGTPSQLRTRTIRNLKVVGIYRHTAHQSLLANSYPTLSRRNWSILDPLEDEFEPVFGLYDSVMILQDQVDEETASLVEGRGFFQSIVLARISQDELAAKGLWNVAGTLTEVRTRFEELHPQLQISGMFQLWRLQEHMNTFLQNQILTILTFPILIMALLLSIFTSETSIIRKKPDIRILRSKGASYNQIMTSLLVESTILAVFGFFLGIGLSSIMAPILGGSIGLFSIDQYVYLQFIEFQTTPPIIYLFAGAIATFLPMTYLFHIARKIDISEVGQPTQHLHDPVEVEEDQWHYGVTFGAILSLLLLMPYIVSPRGDLAIAEVLVSTLILFIISFLGARVMILVSSRILDKSKTLVGQKSLYLSQSLRRRKGQFIPLLIILTLTLTTTTMMIIQSSSFDASYQAELKYSIGSDLRIRCDGNPISFNESILQFNGVNNVTPVMETHGIIGSSRMHIWAIDPLKYLHIGHFLENSFTSGSAFSTLGAFSSCKNGILIPDSYLQLWNKTIGDNLDLSLNVGEASILSTVKVLGTIRSAPGFGAAIPSDIQGPSFASYFGFNDDPLPYVIVSIDFLYSMTGINTADIFLVDLENETAAGPLIEYFNSQRRTAAFTSETYDLSNETFTVKIFLSGVQGLTAIGTVFCAIMGLGSISLFLSCIVSERQNEYAIMRAVGGTSKNILSLVFSEFVGSVATAVCISTLLGVIFGYVMSILTVNMSPFTPILPITPSIPIFGMGVLLLIESIVMCASCYIPARKAGLVDPSGILRNL